MVVTVYRPRPDYSVAAASVAAATSGVAPWSSNRLHYLQHHREPYCSSSPQVYLGFFRSRHLRTVVGRRVCSNCQRRRLAGRLHMFHSANRRSLRLIAVLAQWSIPSVVGYHYYCTVVAVGGFDVAVGSISHQSCVRLWGLYSVAESCSDRHSALAMFVATAAVAVVGAAIAGAVAVVGTAIADIVAPPTTGNVAAVDFVPATVVAVVFVQATAVAVVFVPATAVAVVV